ncbi:MAG: aminotransferase class V-fold PLP-dependent enzyme, partial [Eubacterium sp.]|nr:aminotransferase class V-fold PLP-dependent enzyme [Eubacterium sp.]
PKGVGFIYIADGGKIHPYMHGGGQQKNRRSGTENVPGIAGMSVAVNQAAKDIRDNTKKTSELKRSFLESLKDLDDIIIQGVSEEFGSGRHITPEEIEKATDAELYLPYIISIGIKDIRSEVLLHALEDADIFISSGSACSSNHPGTSRTLTAIGSPKEYLDSTIRLSLSRFTTTEEMEHTSEKLHELIPALRRFTRR